VIDTDVLDETLPVITVKLPLVWPAVTVTLAGKLAADDLLLVNRTVAPPAGAAAFNVTVAEKDAPAVIDVEATVTALTAVAVIEVMLLELLVPVALAVPPLAEAAGVWAGEPEDAPLELVPDVASELEIDLLELVPQPIKIAAARNIVVAVPSERVRDLSLNPLAYVVASKTPKAVLLAAIAGIPVLAMFTYRNALRVPARNSYSEALRMIVRPNIQNNILASTVLTWLRQK
jgi:hypothetical protein